MKLQRFMDLTFETITLDECIKSYGTRVKTLFENVGKYRKSKIDMTQLTETVDQEVASYKVRFNVPKFHLLDKGNSSVVIRAGYTGWPAPFNPPRISPRIKRGEQARQ
jgi:hypothetical protein